MFFIGVCSILLALNDINNSITNINSLPKKEYIDNDDSRYSKAALADYFIKVKEIYNNEKSNGVRYGQVLFNHLAQVRQDLSRQIVATPLDPYYKNEYEELQSFYTWINNEWTKTPKK